MNLTDSYQQLAALLDARQEWLLTGAAQTSFSLRREEIELIFERDKLLLGFLDSKGFQTWRVEDWKLKNGKLHFGLTRNFAKERVKIELAPRVLSGELAQTIESARIEKANEVAALIAACKPPTKIVRVNLNEEAGRFAQIIFETAPGRKIAALADVSGEATMETTLTTAILWLEKLSARRKNPIDKIRIVAEEKSASNLSKLLALLKENRRAAIEVFEILRVDAKTRGDAAQIIRRETEFADLWREKPKKIQTVKTIESSRTASEIIRLAPAEIDVLFTKHGETLRFAGLPFARVRRIFGAEKAWFGTDAKRRILNEKTFDEFTELIENLKTYRRFDADNRRHEFYRRQPESWLESILRRNIKRLDANLILSPVYNQFRVSGDKIDLLALRRDGRLVIVELKTVPDREMIYQAADYWRKVELQRRAGNLRKAEIFGDAEISDEPALVYLVAPTLSFHRDFKFLADTISPQIEIVRFCLNEKWRENLKVMRREEI